jgi:hypothetical protein
MISKHLAIEGSHSAGEWWQDTVDVGFVHSMVPFSMLHCQDMISQVYIRIFIVLAEKTYC